MGSFGFTESCGSLEPGAVPVRSEVEETREQEDSQDRGDWKRALRLGSWPWGSGLVCGSFCDDR